MGKCNHPAYIIKDGKLVCQVCGEPSPRAKMVDGKIIPVGEKRIVCPKCGEVIREEAGAKMESKPEDKKLHAPVENKKSK